MMDALRTPTLLEVSYKLHTTIQRFFK